MAIQTYTQLVTLYSRNYAENQTGWSADFQDEIVTVPSGGTAISACVVFSAGQGADYSLLTGMERSGSDTWNFYFKRHQSDTIYANAHVIYDDGI